MVFATDDKHLYIETKHPSRAGRMLEEQLVLRLRYHNLLQSRRIHMISFSHVAMRRMWALAPKIETFYLRRDWEARVNPKDVREGGADNNIIDAFGTAEPAQGKRQVMGNTHHGGVVQACGFLIEGIMICIKTLRTK